MKTRLVSIITGTIILFTFLLPNTAHAASKYDALTDKLTTPTMINYTSMYGKTCGSTTDNYANKWLWAFRRQQSNDRENHPAAVKSLETAISSTDGAYAVVYERVDNDTGKSYRIHIYWTEHDKASFETIFSDMWRTDGSIAIQSKPGHYKRLHYALVSSPLIQKSVLCTPAFIWGYPDFDEQSVWIHADSAKKIYVSTFDTTYPDGYTGRQIPSKDPALTWKPTSSQYDDLIEKITTNKLINYIDNFRGKTCGSPWVDYSNSWLNLVRRQQFNQREYHSAYMKSLYTAIARGAYAIGYNQINRHNDNSYTGFITVYWTENKSDYKFVFSGEYPTRNLYLKTRRGAKSKLYAAVVASPGITQMIGNCDIEFLWGNNSNEGHISPLFSESYNNWVKLFKSTFDVEYPDGYRGMKVPDNPAKLDYLALGDSYSSGEGDTERNNATGQKYYRQLTDVNEDKKQGIPGEKCHISTRSYPYKLAQYMGLKQTGTRQWDTVACGGATIYDLNGSNSGGYDGQNDRLRDYADKNTLQKMALNEMIPGRVKQIEFVKKYQPKVITLTAGGNDAGFGEKLKACLGWRSLNDCTWAKTEWRSRLKNDLLDQFDRLRSLYNELKIASNNKSKIYVLGYPQFVNGAPDAQCRNTFSLNPREREMITNSVTYYNSIIRQAAKAAGVKYVDVENAFDNHWLCGDNDSHVTAITNIFGANGNEQQESFHPNAKGHADIARAFKKELGGVNPANYKICKNGATTCPDNSATKDNIPIPPYFNVANEQEDIKFTYYKLSNGTATKVQEKYIEIKTSRRPYKPWKKVYVKIYSEPRDLGEIETDENGEINGSVVLPEDLPVGYHTLVVSGEAPDGKKQELYQTILIKGPNPDDIDENGTPDKLQPCGAFAQAAHKDEDLDGIDDACDPEITDPILYVARNGKSEFNEDEGKIYVFRNTRAARLTGVNNDYIDKSSNKDNTEALIASGLTEDTKNLFFSKLIIMKEYDKENNIPKDTPIILSKDMNDKCYALKPEDYLSPALSPYDKNYKSRKLIKLNKLPKGVGCEE